MSIVTTPKPETPKAKSQLAPKLGVSVSHLEDCSIIWVPFYLSSEDKKVLEAVADARTTDDKNKVTVFRAPADALQKWMNDNRASLTKEGEAFIKNDDRTAEELEKEAKRLQDKIKDLQLKLQAKKTPTPPVVTPPAASKK